MSRKFTSSLFLFSLLASLSFVIQGILPAQEAYSQSSSTISISEVVASGLEYPVFITHAGDGSGRLFVIEQRGRIRVIKQGTLLNTPFLDITPQVLFGGERGLLGLAFHPNYEQNGFLYINYTRQSDGATIVARYRVSAANPDLADPSSGITLLTIPQPYSNHNGGCLQFGPDGYLYIGMGDGGSGGDPQNSERSRVGARAEDFPAGGVTAIHGRRRLPYFRGR